MSNRQEKQQIKLISTSGTVPDAVKFSGLKEVHVSDQDTDSDV